MSRSLSDLDPRFRPIAFELLARITEAGLCVMIVDTLRTQAEHEANLANGVSWVKHSKHLDGLAIDLCPYRVYYAHGMKKLDWNTDNPEWEIIAGIGEKLGLRSGYRWKQKDCGHLEYLVPEGVATQHA